MSTLLQLDWQASPAGLPLFQRIAEAITRDVRRGRLRAGEKLPSSRALALMLSVHRNTVLAAYEELRAQGYLETEKARGTFISEEIPAAGSKKVRRGGGTPVKLKLAPLPAKVRYREMSSSALPLMGGLPDIRTLPTAALSRAYRSALREMPTTLDYQGVYGQPRFIKNFSLHLAELRGVVAGEGQMLVTRGSQQALHLAALALNRPGAVIAVEHVGYPPAWESFRVAGACLRPVRVDKNGLVVADLERLCEQEDVAAVYVTPHHQYPTTVTMSAGRRMALLELAQRRGFVIIEDDYDHEFHFEARPVLPLAHADERGVVLHVGTLSKVLAPGLRLGYAVGPEPLIEAMARFRCYLDRQGDHVSELALAYLIEDGELGAHIRRMHRRYEERREALFDALDRELGGVLGYQRPSGGLAVWGRVQSGTSVEKWVRRAEARDVLVQAAGDFFFDKRSRAFLRLGYARLDPEEIREAVRRLRLALPRHASC